MDYARAFSFVFDDPRWKEKIAWGTGLVLLSMVLSFLLVGLLGFAILGGYSVRLLQNVRDGHQYPLPEWDDWGGDLVRGVKYWVVALVYSLPLILFSVPSFVGGIISESGGSAETLGVFITLCASCLMLLYSLFVYLATPGFSIAFATDERIGSGLQFTEIYHWTRDHLSTVAVAVIVVIVASIVFALVASVVGALLCIVGLIVTLPLYSLAIYIYQFHIYGQLAQEYPFDSLPVETAPAPVTPSAPVAPAPSTPPSDPVVQAPPTSEPVDQEPTTDVDQESDDEERPTTV